MTIYYNAIDAAYYNEIDPYAAEWLRNLIRDGHIAPGEVDTRSIEDVCPDDLRPFTQCHFFAGIGIWSLALRRAGWADSRPIWTGSCPCQPFSAAGKGDGFDDERHLWPAFQHLISQCQPSVVCGEQVASKDGRGWLDLVQTDLEALDYATWATVIPVAGVGGPHERHRLWWVALADPDGENESGRRISGLGQGDSPSGGPARERFEGLRPPNGLGDADDAGLERRRSALGRGERAERQAPPCGTPSDVADGEGGGFAGVGSALGSGEIRHVGGGGEASGLVADASSGLAEQPIGARAGPGQAPSGGAPSEFAGRGEVVGLADTSDGLVPQPVGGSQGRNGNTAIGPIDGAGDADGPHALNGFWRNADWLACTDGRWRPVEPGARPLAYGLPRGMGTLGPALGGLCDMAGVDGDSLKRARKYRVGSLRAYGNAISPEPATAFIEAWMGCAP